jgi:hypothetical protein
LEEHKLAAFGAEHVVLPGWSRRWICSWLVRLFSLRLCDWQQALLESGQAGTQGRGEEAIIAHFDEATWQDVLEEALDEMFHGESAGFKLPGV